MFRNIKANLLESIVALVVLALSSWQALEAFGYLYPNIGTGRSSQFSPLKVDKSFILYNSAQENPDCLGYLDGKFNRTLESSTYSLTGELFLSVGQILIPTKIDLEASFNVLGQMAASVAKLSNASTNLTLGALNVDPIEVSYLSTSPNSKSERKKFSVPGPLLLKDFGTGFQLEYPSANKTIPLSLEGLPMEQLLNLKLVVDTDVKTKCMATNRGFIDLVQLSARVKNKVSGLLSQVPPGLLPETSDSLSSK